MLRCGVFSVLLSLDKTDHFILQEEELVQYKENDESSNVETPAKQ